MSIDKNDRCLLLVLRYYSSRVASFEALLKSYNKDTKKQENSNEISVAMLYDKRRVYYGKGDCVQAVSQRVGPTSEMDNEVRLNKRPIPSRLKATFVLQPRRRCSKWLLRPRYSTYRCNFLKIAKFFHATTTASSTHRNCGWPFRASPAKINRRGLLQRESGYNFETT